MFRNLCQSVTSIFSKLELKKKLDEELEENLKMSRQVVRLKIAEERKKQEELRKEIIRIDNDFHENQKRYDNRMKQLTKEVEQKSGLV